MAPGRKASVVLLSLPQRWSSACLLMMSRPLPHSATQLHPGRLPHNQWGHLLPCLRTSEDTFPGSPLTGCHWSPFTPYWLGLLCLCVTKAVMKREWNSHGQFRLISIHLWEQDDPPLLSTWEGEAPKQIQGSSSNKGKWGQWLLGTKDKYPPELRNEFL